MKLLKKISVGSVNGVRGGLKDIKGRVRVMTIVGICGSYVEKTSETMGISYGFKGEFRAINADGIECSAPVAYLPEPAQSMLKTQIDDLSNTNGGNVEFGFHIFALEDDTAIKGYAFELEPLMESRPSTALADLTSRIGVDTAAGEPAAAQIGHDKAETPAKPAAKKK